MKTQWQVNKWIGRRVFCMTELLQIKDFLESKGMTIPLINKTVMRESKELMKEFIHLKDFTRWFDSELSSWDSLVFAIYERKKRVKVWIQNEMYQEPISKPRRASAGKKFDEGKLRYDLIPAIGLNELAKVVTFGATKYGDNNWKLLDDPENRFYAALERHTQAWRMGETIDAESGLHHSSHAATNALFLVWNCIENQNKEN